MSSNSPVDDELIETVRSLLVPRRKFMVDVAVTELLRTKAISRVAVNAADARHLMLFSVVLTANLPATGL